MSVVDGAARSRAQETWARQDVRGRHETPERSLVQRMEALEKANVVRTYRKELKAELKAGTVAIHDLLLLGLIEGEEMPEELETMKLFDLMLATPKYGRVKVNKVLRLCRISPSKTIGGLSPRQRTEVVSMLRR